MRRVVTTTVIPLRRRLVNNIDDNNTHIILSRHIRAVYNADGNPIAVRQTHSIRLGIIVCRETIFFFQKKSSDGATIIIIVVTVKSNRYYTPSKTVRVSHVAVRPSGGCGSSEIGWATRAGISNTRGERRAAEGSERHRPPVLYYTRVRTYQRAHARVCVCVICHTDGRVKTLWSKKRV